MKFECLTLLIGATDDPNFTRALLLLEAVVPQNTMYLHPYVTLWYPTVFSAGTPGFPKMAKTHGGLLGKEITKVDLFYLTGMPMLNVEQLKYFGDLKLSNT